MSAHIGTLVANLRKQEALATATIPHDTRGRQAVMKADADLAQYERELGVTDAEATDPASDG